jgi:hypothetical protein
MVGRSIQGTRPTIMFTSEDKELCKDAFKVTKESGILRDHSEFEADHCPLVAEFELRQIGDMGEGMSRLAGRIGGNGKLWAELRSIKALM